MRDESYESLKEKIQRAQCGDREAMEEIVKENDALVHYIIKRYQGRGKEYEDLYQLGRIGLVRAVQNFDPAFNVRFSTYAFPMILGEVRRFLRDDGQMRVSRTIRENALQVLKTSQKILEETGREANVSEIAEITGMKTDEVVMALGAMRPLKSLTEPIDDKGKRQLQDFIGVNPYDEIDKNLLVQNLMGILNEKERLLIKLRYFEHMTQTRVAEKLGLTQVQVSRLEKKLLLRMRENIV